MMTLVLPFPPTANTNVRHARGAHYLTREHKSFRQRAWFAWHVAKTSPLVGPIAVELVVLMPDRRRRDLDNLIKPVLDALQYAGAYKDDSQVADLHIINNGITAGGSLTVRAFQLQFK